MTNSVLQSEVINASIEEELKRSYLDYAMSVIVSRALPDVCDGLKPVNRRILYAMAELGFDHDKPFRKSANIVGQVVGKYHPHGTDPIYEAMVRMAQDFSMREMLVDGHGNFGSMDGDRAAAMRYTEARLSKAAHMLLIDHDKGTVDFMPNYDETLMMPKVLPARFPNLLVNGAVGIAVGMATNIPTHNLGEVVDCCCAFIDNPDISIEEMMEHMPAPDFPTGATIIGKTGIYEAYRIGRGSFVIQAKCHIEEGGKKDAIIVTEIPYQVNKAKLIERIAELVNNKEIEGISDLRDESDRYGVRIVIETKRDATPEVVLNKLYEGTALRTSFSVNMLAIHNGLPVQMGIRDIFRAFVDFRHDVIIRRTQFYLHKARAQEHLVLGLSVAISHIDEVIAIIKGSDDGPAAQQKLMEREWPLDSILIDYLSRVQTYVPLQNASYKLSEEQAKAILSMRLQRLTGMERGKLHQELSDLCEAIAGYLALLGSKEKIFALMKEELFEAKEKLATKRKSEVVHQDFEAPTDESAIELEEMVVTVSLKGYIKRVPLTVYRSQKRGGRGRSAMETRQEDEVSDVFIADTHTTLLFFSTFGKAYQIKVHELPLGSTTSKGRPLVALFPIEEGETIATLLPMPKEIGDKNIIFATSGGSVRKNALSDFSAIRSNGKIAMKLSDGEELISVVLANEDQDLALSSRNGRSIRFAVSDLRQFAGRTSVGVRGIKLLSGDALVSMSVLDSCPFSQEEREAYMRMKNIDDDVEAGADSVARISQDIFEKMQDGEEFILSVSEKGFGKRTSSYLYRRMGRGGQGVSSMDISKKTGPLIKVMPVKNDDQILLLSDKGQLLRCPVGDIRIAGRKTQGVKLFRLGDDETIVSIAIAEQEEVEIEIE